MSMFKPKCWHFQYKNIQFSKMSNLTERKSIYKLWQLKNKFGFCPYGYSNRCLSGWVCIRKEQQTSNAAAGSTLSVKVDKTWKLYAMLLLTTKVWEKFGYLKRQYCMGCELIGIHTNATCLRIMSLLAVKGKSIIKFLTSSFQVSSFSPLIKNL